jgi:2-hydroxychromene-2-carboxylate isomerase
MGTLIDLASRRAARAERGAAAALRGVAVVFSFDTASPYTYLAAERVDRMFPAAAWEPVCPRELVGVEELAQAEQRARALRMPLVWPDAWRADGRRVRRVAAFAATVDRAPAFVVAAGRLAFAGGFDLDDPAVLCDAAAAAGLPVDAALDAAEDLRYDDALAAAARRLHAAGARELPLLEVGGRRFEGEARLAEAMAASTAATA